MSLNKENIRMVVPLTLGAIAGITLKSFEQPNEISFVIAIITILVAFPTTSFFIQLSSKSESAPVEDISDEEVSEEEEEVVTTTKRAKKKRSRYAARKAAREENKDSIAAEKEKKRKAREAEAKRIADLKAAEAAAAAAAAAESASSKKKKKKRKGKNKAKAAEAEKKAAELAAAAAVVSEPEEEEWQEVPTTQRRRAANDATDDDEEGEPTSTDVSEELRLDPKYYGGIIGTGGATLKLIMEATEAKINMPKKGLMNRDMITIKGSPAAVELAKKTIVQLAKTGYSALTHPDFEASTIDVARRHHGLVMGKAGANIRAIQKETGTRVNMPDKSIPSTSPDANLITIVGTFAAIKLAKKSIRELIVNGYSDLTHDNWTKVEVPFPSELVSNLVGKGGDTIRLLQARYEVQINTPAPNAIPSYVVILGPAANVVKAEKEVRNLAVMDDAVVEPCWGGREAGFDLSSLNSW